MKYLISLFLMFVLATPLGAEEDHDWSKFYQLKTEVKNIVTNVSSLHGNSEFSIEEEAAALKLDVEEKLRELKEKTPFSFDVFYEKPPQTGQIVPELVLTVAAKYEDELGKVIWGFFAAFYNYKIEFFSGHGFPPKPGDYYNYLTLYKA